MRDAVDAQRRGLFVTCVELGCDGRLLQVLDVRTRLCQLLLESLQLWHVERKSGRGGRFRESE